MAISQHTTAYLGQGLTDQTAANEIVTALNNSITHYTNGAAVAARGKITECVRRRCTIAEINAGVTLLAAITGKSYRMVSCKAIAYGGAVGATTTVDVLGTQSASSVKLAAFAQANLTRSTVLTAGGTGGTVLADGASYAACDAGTAITVSKTNSDLTTATGVDIIFEYVVE